MWCRFLSQETTQIQGSDSYFSLANHVGSQEPNHHRQFVDLQELAVSDSGLMAAGTELITLQAPYVDNALIIAVAMRSE